MDLQAWYLDSDQQQALEKNCANNDETILAATTQDASRFFQSATSWLVIVGEGSLVKGLDIGLAHMKEGQTAYIYCRPSVALGSHGTRRYQKCQVPPGSAVIYQATVTTIVQDTSRLNPYFPIQKALTRKKIANDLYQYEIATVPPSSSSSNMEARTRALDLYRQAARDMKDLLAGTYFASVEPNHPQRKECQQIVTDCYNNVVVIYLHVKDYDRALEAVDVALERTSSFPSKNIKALVRRAKICVQLASSTKKLTRAQQAIQAAEDALSYKNQTEEAELRKIKALYKKRREQLSAGGGAEQ